MPIEMTIDGKTTPLEINDKPSYADIPAAEPAPSITRPAPRPAPAAESKSTRARTAAKPSKAEKPRVAKEPVVLDQKDYTEALDASLTGLWVATASIPFTTAYAAVIDLNKPGLTASLNLAANNSPTARRVVEKWTGGSGGMWAVSLAVVGVNMGMQTYQLSRDPELRRQLADSQRAKLQDWAKTQGITEPLKAEEVKPDDKPTG